jgi:acyl-CoA thioesterase
MEEHIRRAIFQKVEEEPFARKLNLQLVELDDGYSVVEMTFTKDVENIFGMALRNGPWRRYFWPY